MTPRTSVRAAARDYYAELVCEQAGANGETTTEPAADIVGSRQSPLPEPPPHIREGSEGEQAARQQSAAAGQTAASVPPSKVPADLMARVRALYEDSAVPVRAIAAEIGVCERTLYKYAFRLGWRPRYGWPDDSACMRGRGWRAAGPCAPVKGAGGRFVRREDAGKPHPQGLKALDAAGRARAEAACAESERHAHLARLMAECDRCDRERSLMLEAFNGALDEVVRHRELPPALRDAEIGTLCVQNLDSTIGVLQAARRAAEQAAARLAAAQAAQRPGRSAVNIAFERSR